MNLNFNPNTAAPPDSGIFGLPFSVDEAKLVLLPVPWEATTSYGEGTAQGPLAILNASKQIDLFDRELGDFFSSGIAMMEVSEQVQQWNTIARRTAKLVIEAGGPGGDPTLQTACEMVNHYSELLNQWVYVHTSAQLSASKCIGIVGGDHSTPFGAIQAFLEHYPDMGILHIDAHADLRVAFEGFTHSHASIMYNVLAKTFLKKLVQVGIRDLCHEEYELIQESPDRILTFFDDALSERKMQGHSWDLISKDIVGALPQQVYISLDIDGLDPRYCPNTGTPVPGGLDFSELMYLFKVLKRSGRLIVGFDLNEVSPGIDTQSEWDANVAARILYKLCGLVLSSHSNYLDKSP